MNEGGLSLEVYDELIKGGDSGAGIVAKNLVDSLVYARASGEEEPIMPPEDNTVGAKPLTPDELKLLKQWIEQGAPPSNVAAESIQWQPIPDSVKAIYATDMSPDGHRMAYATANRVEIFDSATGQSLGKLIDPSLQPPGVADVDMIQSVAFSPLGNLIATGGFRTVRIWKRSVPESQIHPALANGVLFSNLSPDGSKIATANAFSDIEVWDLKTKSKLATITPRDPSLTGLVWLSEERLAASEQTGAVRIYQVSNGSVLNTAMHGSPIHGLTASDDRTWLAAVDGNRHVVLFHIGEQIDVSPIDSVADVTGLAFVSQPKPGIAVATKANTIQVLALDSRQAVYQLDHGNPVSALAASGASLLSADQNGKVVIWNLADGKQRAALQGNRASELRLAIAQRDAARETKTVERLEKATETLTAELKKEDELLAKVTEEHKKATEELTAEAKKETDAQAKLKASEQKLAMAQQTLTTSEKTKKDTETQIVQLTATVQQDSTALATIEKQSQEAAAVVTKLQQEVAELQKQLEAAQTNATKIAKQATDKKAAIEKKQQEIKTKKQQVTSLAKAATDAKATIDASTKEIEADKKSLAAVTEAKTKKTVRS